MGFSIIIVILQMALNCSEPSENRVFLNGPKLQEDLMSILLRFRQHKIVVCGDVAKMYRVIWINPQHRSLQRTFWRGKSNAKLEEYTLNTVTYGTKSAPYLAIRCLKQLGLDNVDMYPEAANTILTDFYVDDLLTRTKSMEEASCVQKWLTF